MNDRVLVSGKAGYEPIFEGKGYLSGQGAELTCGLTSHFSVITDQGGTTVN